MHKAGDLLSGFFDSIDPDRLGSFRKFYTIWKGILGERLAAHTKIIDTLHGTLLVAVDHPAWSQTLQMKQDQILRRIQSEVPELEINSIRIRIGRPEDFNHSDFGVFPDTADEPSDDEKGAEGEGEDEAAAAAGPEQADNQADGQAAREAAEEKQRMEQALKRLKKHLGKKKE
ncbi:MAG: DUF721 domain-containing protein [Spirochaetales bacterium]|nr:DUF721 domain-containing protein [Spirochaetales bacterium]MCF7939868.1 DUF721 domain-containing protein [Spirochaetales bacterium]